MLPAQQQNHGWGTAWPWSHPWYGSHCSLHTSTQQASTALRTHVPTVKHLRPAEAATTPLSQDGSHQLLAADLAARWISQRQPSGMMHTVGTLRRLQPVTGCSLLGKLAISSCSLLGLLLLFRRLCAGSIQKCYSTGGVALCERSLPQCGCSLLADNAIMAQVVVVADMSICSLHSPQAPLSVLGPPHTQS
jgi:hypothetical protein